MRPQGQTFHETGRSCCVPVLLGEFKPEVGLQLLGERHTGPFCAGDVEGLVIGPWRRKGLRVLSGEKWSRR